MHSLVLACSVCFGASDSPLAKGANMGIFFMLGVTFFGVFITPVFFYVIEGLGEGRRWASASSRTVLTVLAGGVAGLALAREVNRLRRAGARVLVFQATVAVAEEMGLNAMDPERRAPVAHHAYESALRRIHRADARGACEMLMKTRRP